MTRSQRLANLWGLPVLCAVLIGWLAGSPHYNDEHSCPARGPCPSPPHPHLPFDWTSALIAGAFVGAILLIVLALADRTKQ